VSLPDLKSAKPEFTDPESLPELTERMANEQLKTFESKLLIAIAFMNSVCISPDKKRAKKFFNKFKKGLKILFNSWTSNSITEIMKIQELPADGLAFELLVEIASLIFKCDLVDKMSKLDTMKQKTGTDWRNVLTEVRKFMVMARHSLRSLQSKFSCR
jgi:flagellar biosynthesis regulator FlbT